MTLVYIYLWCFKCKKTNKNTYKIVASRWKFQQDNLKSPTIEGSLVKLLSNNEFVHLPI